MDAVIIQKRQGRSNNLMVEKDYGFSNLKLEKP